MMKIAADLPDSEMIDQVIWVANSCFFQFNNGDVWRVDGFTFSQYQDMMSAESLGRYYNQHIRNTNEVQVLDAKNKKMIGVRK